MVNLEKMLRKPFEKWHWLWSLLLLWLLLRLARVEQAYRLWRLDTRRLLVRRLLRP